MLCILNCVVLLPVFLFAFLLSLIPRLHNPQFEWSTSRRQLQDSPGPARNSTGRTRNLRFKSNTATSHWSRDPSSLLSRLTTLAPSPDPTPPIPQPQFIPIPPQISLSQPGITSSPCVPPTHFVPVAIRKRRLNSQNTPPSCHSPPSHPLFRSKYPHSPPPTQEGRILTHRRPPNQDPHVETPVISRSIAMKSAKEMASSTVGRVCQKLERSTSMT
jgi:hypothetical protein